MKQYGIFLMLVSVSIMQAELSVRQKNYKFEQIVQSDSQQDAITFFDTYFSPSKSLSRNRQYNAQLFLQKYYPQFSGIELDATTSLQQLVSELQKKSQTRTVTVQDEGLIQELRKQIADLQNEVAILKATKTGIDNAYSGSTSPSSSSGSSSPSSVSSNSNQTTSGQTPPPPPPPPMPGQCLPGGLGLPFAPPPPPMPFSLQVMKPKKVSGLEQVMSDYQDLLKKFKTATALSIDEKSLRSYGMLNSLIKRKATEIKELENKDEDSITPFVALLQSFPDQYTALIALTKVSKDGQELQKKLQTVSSAINHKIMVFENEAEVIAQKNPNQDIEELLFPVDKELTDALKQELEAENITITMLKKEVRDFNQSQGSRQKQLDAVVQDLENGIRVQTMQLPSSVTMAQRVNNIIEKLEDIINVYLNIDTQKDGIKKEDTLGNNQNERQLQIEREAGIGPLKIEQYTGQPNPFYINQRIETYDALSNVPNDEYAVVGFLKEGSTATFGIFTKLLQSTEKLALVDQKLELWVLGPAVVDYKTDIYFEKTRSKHIDKTSQRAVDDSFPKLKIVKEKRIAGQQALYLFAIRPENYTGIAESKECIPYIYWKLVPRIATKQKGGLGKIIS